MCVTTFINDMDFQIEYLSLDTEYNMQACRFTPLPHVYIVSFTSAFDHHTLGAFKPMTLPLYAHILMTSR